MTDHEKKWKDKVETALADYAANLYNASAGWNVMRYAEKGLLKSNADVPSIETALMYYAEAPEVNGNFAFEILTYAQLGLLEFKSK